MQKSHLIPWKKCAPNANNNLWYVSRRFSFGACTIDSLQAYDLCVSQPLMLFKLLINEWFKHVAFGVYMCAVVFVYTYLLLFYYRMHFSNVQVSRIGSLRSNVFYTFNTCQYYLWHYRFNESIFSCTPTKIICPFFHVIICENMFTLKFGYVQWTLFTMWHLIYGRVY